MENKAQRKVLMIIAILILIIAILAYILSLFVSDDHIDEPTDPGIDNPSEVVRDEIALLEDESVFFSVQNVINQYYNYIFEENTSELFLLLDPEYLDEYGITSNNIYSVIGNDYGITSYMANNIYYNPDSSVTYYFVTGYLTSNSIMGDEYQYVDDVSFLIIVDEATHRYVLRPIEVSDLRNYAENYHIVDRNIEEGNRFQVSTYSLESKLTTYLSEFINLLINNPEEAYQLLDDNKKKEYQSYQDFESHIVDIYNMLSSRIFSYSSREEDGVTLYDIIDNKQNEITIYEYSLMNYQISF